MLFINNIVNIVLWPQSVYLRTIITPSPVFEKQNQRLKMSTQNEYLTKGVVTRDKSVWYESIGKDNARHIFIHSPIIVQTVKFTVALHEWIYFWFSFHAICRER